MHRWLLVLYLIFAMPLVAEGKSAKEIVRDTFPSVVKIVSIDADGEISVGSGFFVARNVIATNFHVIKNLRNGFVNVIGQKPQYFILKTIASDENNDIALLRVSDVKAAPLSFGDSQTVSVGEVVYAIGNPSNLEGTISNGIISGVREGGILQTNAPISPGSSGGPLLNETGEVIGIIVGFFITGQNLNFAIPAIELEQLMRRSGIRYVSRSSIGPPRNDTVLPQPPKTVPGSPLPRDIPQAERTPQPQKATPESPRLREMPQAAPTPDPSFREEIARILESPVMPQPLKAPPTLPSIPQAAPAPQLSLREDAPRVLADARPTSPPKLTREAPATAPERCPPKAQRYCAVLQAAVNRMWNSDYNPAFRQILESAGNSTAVMLIVIRPDGVIESIALRESSGNKSYDLAIESLLRHQKSFPPLPEELRGEPFQAVLSFRR